MTRLKNKLTPKTVAAIKAPGYYSDGGGLYLQVSKTLSKSWLLIYKKSGKKFEMGLGSLSVTSLAEAREKAHEYQKLLASGVDPLAEKRKQEKERLLINATSMTFKQCADAYINIHRHGLKNKKHIQQWENTLEQYCHPIIGHLAIADVDTRLITKCLEPIWITKNETASRLRGRIEQVLSWATVSGYRTGDNPARWRGHLDKILPKPSKVQITKHHPALPYSEIGSFMKQLKQQEGTAARCLEFTILTATRTNETIGAKWNEIDFGAKVWTIPSDRMKAKKEHRIPLPDLCVELLRTMQTTRLNDYIFPGQRNGLSNMAMLKLLERMDRKDITVHGFRSTFRDWAAETTDYPGETVEMCLAHTIKNQAEAAYRRGDLLEKRLCLMTDWAKFCITTHT
jgi:integrase